MWRSSTGEWSKPMPHFVASGKGHLATPSAEARLRRIPWPRWPPAARSICASRSCLKASTWSGHRGRRRSWSSVRGSWKKCRSASRLRWVLFEPRRNSASTPWQSSSARSWLASHVTSARPYSRQSRRPLWKGSSRARRQTTPRLCRPNWRTTCLAPQSAMVPFSASLPRCRTLASTRLARLHFRPNSSQKTSKIALSSSCRRSTGR
mmetsp:Transcript_16780/g.50091  ORF Transcript_16780/g.50091 Transcript_16780/m.50091 type:complete len:207 (+) Transcript_16780:445-1065(+)